MVTLALIPHANAQSLQHISWVEPAFKGYDAYYGSTITGYLEGTNWTITMSWINAEYPPHQLNVSAIRIYFDWGKNYTHTFSSPVAVKSGNVQTISISDVTPSVSEASELWRHSYSIYIHHVNATAGPLKEMGSEYMTGGSDFAVLSTDHLACLNIWMKYATFMPFDSGAQAVTPTIPNITAVQLNMTKASQEFQIGGSIFEAGVFSTAKSHLQLGESYYNSALASWLDKGTAIEDADLAQTKSETNYNNALSSSAMINACGWLFFGLGWTFIGLGIIIYGLRKPKATAS